MDNKKQKWLVIEDEGWEIVMPETDIKPHSTTCHHDKQNDLAWSDCPCKPHVSFAMQVIVHNSFLDNEKIDESMNRIFTEKK